MTLKAATVEELEAELAKRKAPKAEKPTPFVYPDWSVVTKLCRDHIDQIERGEAEDSDIPHYIYEAAMCAVYGPGIFNDLINKRL